MCGIGGQYNWRTNAPVDRAQLEWMGYTMRHRGPDGAGVYVDGAVGLAHRRLAIIDIEGGHQPMSTPDGSLWIVYNGEVYNFVELLDELRLLGYEPRTRSDTEAVLLAYAHWGLDFTSHLNGMWGLAIWDAPRQRLVLSRDRMGIKPLYYAETKDGIVFGSEVKALRTVSGVADSIDIEALDDFMTCGYVVRPRSVLRGVYKVVPGTTITVEPKQGLKRHTYWRLQFEPDFQPSEKEWCQRVEALFTDAVRLRLRSDVPLGTLLSGGVDSTLIAATLAELEGGGAHGIDSFCVGVDVPGGVHEFDWASKVARRLGLRHHEYRLTSEAHGAALTDACRFLDEPLVEPMIGQLLAVCRLAREFVTVVLSGEGADETWFGYSGYRTQYAIELAQRALPSPVLKWVHPLLERATRVLPVSPRMAKYMRLATEPLKRRYLGLNYFDTTVKDVLYAENTRAALRGRDARESMFCLYDRAGGPEPLSCMAAVDCRAWLVDNSLLRSDAMSMAASLELRVPFLDHRLVELASTVPAKFKVHVNSQKVILKRALAARLPQEVANRKKVGFPTPLAELLRGDWGKQAGDVLASPSPMTKGLFDTRHIMNLLERHRSGAENWCKPLFQMLMLEYWARNFTELPERPPQNLAQAC